MKLLGIVTATGRTPIGGSGRLATINLYFDGTYQAQIEVQVEDPEVGDCYDMELKKQNRRENGNT